jgi:long-chain fatty acid transport protein
MKRLVLGASLAVLVSGQAMAGGFAVREQSTIGQGLSFAGVAAGGGGLSSLFWNPAVAADYNQYGFISESNAALIVPYSKSNNGSGNIGELALVPASYYSYGLTEQLTIAASLNAPFGLGTDGRDGWLGTAQGDTSEVTTYNLNPSASYKLNDMFSVGIGAQVQYMKAHLTRRTSPAGVQFSDIEGDDIGFGFTAGILFKPTETTDIGLGFRSAIKHRLKGNLNEGLPIRANFTSPEIVTLGLRQQVTDQLDLLAGVEWANWSRFKELRVTTPAGGLVGVTPENWKDSWHFSLGAEYAYSDALTLRSGVAYEISPVTGADRNVTLPDNDRFWLSLGGSYKISDSFTANLAYSHVFVKDGTVNIPANTTFKQHIDIVSVGLTSDW